MGDLISRQAAIEAFNTEIMKRRLSEDTNDDGSLDEFDTESILRALPSAQSGWIPCTPETMPEREGRYVCTYTYDGKKDVFMFRYEDGQFMVPWYVETVTAWYKPLDPWEGGHGETD